MLLLWPTTLSECTTRIWQVFSLASIQNDSFKAGRFFYNFWLHIWALVKTSISPFPQWSKTTLGTLSKAEPSANWMSIDFFELGISLPWLLQLCRCNISNWALEYIPRLRAPQWAPRCPQLYAWWWYLFTNRFGSTHTENPLQISIYMHFFYDTWTTDL